MKQLSFSLTLFLMAILAFPNDIYAEQGKNGVNWKTNYQKALLESKQSGKPILLFFTGSDWCGWCKKLEREVFETPEFAQAMKDKMIFVVLDYPMKKRLPDGLNKQNQALKKQYSIKSYPTVILINANEQLIGSTGYRSGGGRIYVNHLTKMINEYSAYTKKMTNISKVNYSGKELKRLYQKAQELGLNKDANQLIKLGVDSDQSYFFLAKHYHSLLDQGKIDSIEAAVIKQQLLASDPTNEHLTHYQVAVSEFEIISEYLDKKNQNPDAIVMPLVNYVEIFKNQDKENAWKLNMVISQVYLDHNEIEKALKYAEYSYDSAPESIRSELAQAVKKIKSQSVKVQ